MYKFGIFFCNCSFWPSFMWIVINLCTTKFKVRCPTLDKFQSTINHPKSRILWRNGISVYFFLSKTRNTITIKRTICRINFRFDTYCCNRYTNIKISNFTYSSATYWLVRELFKLVESLLYFYLVTFKCQNYLFTISETQPLSYFSRNYQIVSFKIEIEHIYHGLKKAKQHNRSLWRKAHCKKKL